MARRAIGVDGELLESAWQAQVVGAARVYGWRAYHAPDGGTPARAGGRRVVGGQLPEGRGFPDLLLLRGARLVIAELKTSRGRLGPGQAGWLEAWQAFAIGKTTLDGDDEVAAVEVYLWRPSDWPEVQAVLGRGQARRHDLDPTEWTA